MSRFQKKKILKEVKKGLREARKEIIATMLLEEELKNPLPSFYFDLLKKKINKGIVLKRIGFGDKEDYNKIKKKIGNLGENYLFKYITENSNYQRLIIIDRKKLFFGFNDIFFQSSYKPLIKVFLDYFDLFFKKGNI